MAGAQITVSIRDDNHAPVVNAAVDAFKAAVAFEAKAFKDDGGCSSRTSEVDGAQKCEIDGADPATQSDGNITLATLQGAVGDGQTVWIWTGDLGDKVGSDTDLFEMSVEKGAEDLPAAASATIASDLAKQPGVSPPADVTRVGFGTTVTYTIQLQGDPDTDPNTDNNVNVGPPDGDPTTYTVVTKVFADANDDGSIGNLTQLAQSTATVTIGSDGSATFTATAADSDPDNSGNMITVEYTVTAATGGIAAVPTPGTVVFSDEASVVTYVTVEVGGAQVAPGAGGTAGNAATVTALDQFGNPMGSAGVILKSNNPTGANDADGSTIRTTALLTGSTGQVRIGYSYSGIAAEETLVAMWDGYKAAQDLNGDGDMDDDGEQAIGTQGTAEVGADGQYTCQDEDVCGETDVYWVLPATAAVTTGTPSVLTVDADNDQAVVDFQTGGNITPTSVNYDDNDYYTIITEVDGGDVSTPSTVADFEAALAKALEPGGSGATLTWTSYVYDDPSDIASFVLDVTG